MRAARHSPVLWALNSAPLLLFVAVLLVFGLLSPKFLEAQNLVNILIQSSSTGDCGYRDDVCAVDGRGGFVGWGDHVCGCGRGRKDGAGRDSRWGWLWP